MIQVLIVDDHVIFREGIKQIILSKKDNFNVDEADNGKEAVEKIMNNQYHVVILDISMPGRSGLDILKQIKEIQADLPVLILTTHPEESYAVRSLKSGASGYLTK